jgi:transcription antitermination factor NusG
MSWYATTDLSDPNLPWIAVHTRARSEKRVAGVLAYWGVQAWAPTAPVRRRWSDRWKVIEWPLFPGYVFARVPADHWYPLLDVPGVFTVVKDGRHAAAVAPEVLENVRAFADRLAGVKAEPERVPWFAVGDVVLVRDGPFAGLTAHVVRTDGHQRVAIGLSLLGQGVSVTVPVQSLLRQSA